MFSPSAGAFSIAREFAIPGANGVAVSPDGSTWVQSEVWNDPSHVNRKLYKVTPKGAIASWPITKFDGFGGIAAGADGNIWVGLRNAPSYGKAELLRVEPSGSMKRFRLPGRLDGSSNLLIAAGPEGDMWFTGLRHAIDRMSPSGHVTTMHVAGSDQVTGMTQGSEGGMWLSRSDFEGYFDPGFVHALRVSPAGHIRRFKTHPSHAIALGPDGNMWLASTNALERLTPSGKRTRFRTTQPYGGGAYVVTAAPNRTVAYATATIVEPYGDFSDPYTLGTMKTNGVSSQTIVGNGPNTPEGSGLNQLGASHGMVTGADGMLWTTSDSGLSAVSIGSTGPRLRGHPTFHRATASAGALHLDLRCTGSVGVFCAGEIVASENGHRIIKRRYALAPMNRLDLNIRRNLNIGSKLTLRITSRDPLTLRTSRVTRRITVS